LINENCASACEDFLVDIYEVPDRPLIIGTETAGTTGAPLVINLPNEGMARICTLRITYPYSGKPFVEKGVSPDIAVRNSLDDDLSGYDRALETAIKHIRNSQ
jgi:C-terminal processing protease CtpA/Prc